MLASFPPVDPIIEDSRRLHQLLEAQSQQVPMAGQLLAAHLPTHTTLEQQHSASERAVDAWRRALARRWTAEVDGLRLFRQSVQEISGLLGTDAPEVLLLARAEQSAQGSPGELLAALRQLRATVELCVSQPSLIAQRDTIKAACERLAVTTEETQHCEEARRHAVLERRIAQDAYRRLRAIIAGELAQHGVHLETVLGA